MAIAWTTPAGDLGILTERQSVNIPLSASSDTGNLTYKIISGNLPRGLRLSNNVIVGSPTEVTKFTESRFVVRAEDSNDKKDRTFKLSVDGSDVPEWVTEEGFLNVGPEKAYFVLDDSNVDFQLEAYDPDSIAGDTLEYYLVPNAGELPPGLSLSKSGRISGFTKPIFSVVYNSNQTGAFDTQSYDTMPLDIAAAESNGFDTYLYDNQTYDYNEPSQTPDRLSRIYTFTVAVTDGVNFIGRTFKIYVVTEEFLQADNSIVQVDTNLFQADSSSDRRPFWITDPYLGRWRANNYVTLRLDVYDPPSLEGTIGYLLTTNPGTYRYKLTGEVIYNGRYEISGTFPDFPKSRVQYNIRSFANPDDWEVLVPETESELPPGVTLDSVTGDVAGRVPYQSAVTKNYAFTIQAINFPKDLPSTSYVLTGKWSPTVNYAVNQAVTYNNVIYICILANKNQTPTNDQFWAPAVSSADRTFTIDIIGEIESAITWKSDEDLGSIKVNQPSRLFVEAESTAYGGTVVYTLVEGVLPPGLEFLPSGEIVGKVQQFSDSDNRGLTRLIDAGELSIFDGVTTTFDLEYRFTVRASDFSKIAQRDKEFLITVLSNDETSFANLYVRALQSKEKRLAWFDFITDSSIFKPEDLYRNGDKNFSVQTDLKVLLYAGIESVEAVKFVQAMSRNHYRKRLLLGDIKLAKGKDLATQETVYEVVYAEVIDPLEKEGKSISDTVNLRDDIESKVLVSYDAIKIDSDIPLVSDSDHQRVFPNSVKNMRNRINSLGERDREFLPLWMRSIQDGDAYEPGFTKALVLCYAKPGKGESIIARIKQKTNYASRGEYSPVITYQINDSVLYQGEYYTCIRSSLGTNPDEDVKQNLTADRRWTKNFNFKNINFEVDRYIIDILDGEIEDKYLAFPQRGEKLP